MHIIDNEDFFKSIERNNPRPDPRGTIEVMVKDQYGTQVYHPYNTDAKLLAQLAGTKTLTTAALKVALQLGYEITYIRPEVPAL